MNTKSPALYSTADVAKARGVTPQAVTRVAAKTGIGRRISGVWTFTEAEKRAILRKLQSVPGNPNFRHGHKLGNGRGKLSRKSPKQGK